MNKNEFIKELSTRLKYIPAEDREDAISYYTEYIEDMHLDENEDVTEKIGQPKDVAKEILADVKDKHITQQKEHKSAKGGATVVWLVILGLLSAPLSIPLGIALLAIACVVVITALAVLITLGVAALALIFAGLVSIAAIFVAASFSQGLMCFGIGLTSIGVGILTGFGLFKLFQVIFNNRKNGKKELEA